MTPEQARAARMLLKWSRERLAAENEMSIRTIVAFESGDRPARKSTVACLRKAFEMAGVEFTNGDQPGVRLKKAAL